MAERLMDHGFVLSSGGTDNHLMLVDLSNKNVSGKEAEIALDKAGITCNKNMVPSDTRSPFDPSGIRLGTPAITTRGFKEDDCREVADHIKTVIENINNEAKIKEVREKVLELCSRHPLYPEIQ